MTVNQIYKIVNNVAKQMYGENAPEVTNLTGLISLGNDVMSSSTTKDTFLNALVDRIGRTIISTRAYNPEVKSLINDAFVFGAIMQKIYVEPQAATNSAQWDLTNNTSVDQYVITKPTVKQKLFSIRNTWEVDITIPDFQLATAFTSETEMTAFVDAIFLAIRNSMEVYLEGMANMCYCNMIAERVVNTEIASGHTAIDLLTEYNSATGDSLTTKQAMMNTEFLKFASMTINLTMKKMAKMTRIYNSESYARFTPLDRMRVTMLADFTSACASYLQANTYHDEMVALPNYTEVMYWQGIGSGDPYTGFDNTGSVYVTTSDGYTVKQDHVICILSDEEALGLTYDNRRSKSSYNAKGEYTNFFEKADIGYFNDLSENAVIFTVGKLATPTLSSVAPIQNTFSIDAPTDVVVTVTFNGKETVSAVNYSGSALSTTDYSVSGTTYTFKEAWIATLGVGMHEVDFVLSTNAILSLYITVTA
jgi:hypothetical protein